MPQKGGTMIELNASAQTKVTDYAQRQLNLLLYEKGKSFVQAALLLHVHSKNKPISEYVVLHIFCQGTEIILKALLLLKDDRHYRPLLKKKRDFGHNLEKLSIEVVTQYGLNPISPELLKELQALNSLFSNHFLRYGSLLDAFNPNIVASDLVMKRVLAAIRLTNFYLFNSSNTP